MGPMNDSQVCLQRDALSTPWGFRLQGGKDFKVPLTVQRVFVGSPADGELHRGDAILGINGYDASNMIHKQAQDLIKNAGGTINLIVRKASGGAPPPQSRQGFQAAGSASDQGYRSRVLDTFTPKPAPPIGSNVTNAHAPMNYQPQQQQGFVPNQYGTDYSIPRAYSAPARPRGPPPPGSMLNRVQNTLTTSVYGYDQNDQNGGDENYTAVPVNQLKQVFSGPDHHQQYDEEEVEVRKSVRDLKSVYNNKSSKSTAMKTRQRPRPASHSPMRPAWTKPTDCDPGLSEPGWSPVKSPHSAPRFSAPVNSHVPPNRPAPVNRPDPGHQHAPMNHPAAGMGVQPQLQQQNFSPAWAGSLKSSGGPKQWEVREQTAIASGGPAPPHMQEHPAPAPHQPRVQNAHYGPGETAPQYQQQGDGGASDNATVAHLQYNTPIGLYSKNNVSEVLKGQTSGRPGEGTLQVSGGGPGQKSFDPNRSEVLRLLQEEERPHQRGYGLNPSAQGAGSPGQPQQQQQQQQPQQQQHQASPRQSARHENEQHYAGFVDPNKQSPMMHALENQMASVQVGDGTSDF